MNELDPAEAIGQRPSRSHSDDDYTMFHEEVIIEGIKCVKWSFPDISDNIPKSEKDKERSKRRKAKEIVGSDNLDVPMLDSKAGRDGMELCDIIMITEHLDAWEAGMVDTYSRMGYTHDKRIFNTTGFQISWSDGDTFISLSFH